MPGACLLGERVDVCAQLLDGALGATADDRHDEPLVGLDGDAEVVAVEEDDLVTLEAGVQLRELLQRERGRLQHDRQQLLEVDRREVALLDVGHGRHLAVGARQMLDDLPPDTTDLFAAPLRRSL